VVTKVSPRLQTCSCSNLPYSSGSRGVFRSSGERLGECAILRLQRSDLCWNGSFRRTNARPAFEEEHSRDLLPALRLSDLVLAQVLAIMGPGNRAAAVSGLMMTALYTV
jgi:hypothetical protein